MQHNKIFEFLQTIDDIYGVYLDSTHGFDTVRNNFIKTQKLLKIPDEELKEKNIFYGRGNPNHKNSYPLHRCTQEEFKRRNEINGKNYTIIANLCLVQIYQYPPSTNARRSRFCTTRAGKPSLRSPLARFRLAERHRTTRDRRNALRQEYLPPAASPIPRALAEIYFILPS